MSNIFNESTSFKDNFRITANKLLNHSFIIKKKEDTRKDYLFVISNRAYFESYFDLLGYELIINDDQGVIGLKNTYGHGKLALKKYESIMLLILRLMYLEKRKEISSGSDEVIVLVEEIREKYQMLKVKNKLVLDKTLEKNILSLFKKYNLIKNLDSDLNDIETRIIIYPSILLALYTDDISSYHEQIQNKLNAYAKEGEDDEEGIDED